MLGFIWMKDIQLIHKQNNIVVVRYNIFSIEIDNWFGNVYMVI